MLGQAVIGEIADGGTFVITRPGCDRNQSACAMSYRADVARCGTG